MATTNDASYDSEDEPLYTISKIPYFCLSPPEIPNGRFEWNCRGCNHCINLLNPSPDILNELSDEKKKYLLDKLWKLKDERLQLLLYELVSNHYREFHVPDDIQESR